MTMKMNMKMTRAAATLERPRVFAWCGGGTGRRPPQRPSAQPQQPPLIALNEIIINEIIIIIIDFCVSNGSSLSSLLGCGQQDGSAEVLAQRTRFRSFFSDACRPSTGTFQTVRYAHTAVMGRPCSVRHASTGLCVEPVGTFGVRKAPGPSS